MRRISQTILLSLWLSLSLFGADFRYVRFNVPGAVATGGRGINNRGQIVGVYFDSNNVGHGFFYDRGNFQTIDFPGAGFTAALGINDHGDIVGRWTQTDVSGFNHSFLLKKGKLTLIDGPPDCPDLSAFGITDAGNIVGTCFDSDGVEHGFVLNGKSFTIIDAPNADATDARGINNRGQVVGAFEDPATGFIHGYFRKAEGQFRIFDFPGGFSITVPRDINNLGDIVGVYWNNEDPHHGFLLRDNHFVTIDVPGSDSMFCICANNDRGMMVGGYLDALGLEHGFVAARSAEREEKE